jgi:hypothetical protein
LFSQDIDSLANRIQTLEKEVKRINTKVLSLVQQEEDEDEDKISNTLAPDSLPSYVLHIPKSDMRESQVLLTGKDLISDEFPASWPMFGTEYRMKVGGRVKLDMLYDVNGTGDRYNFLMSQIPVQGSAEYANRGYFNMFARESRINVDMRRVTFGKLPLQIFIEGDFWSSSSSSLFRLRHAYIVAGNFVFGHNWSTTSLLESIPYLIDFAAGDALYGTRTTQLKYQKRVNDHWKWALALEMKDYLGIDNSYDLPGEESLGLPALAGRIDYTWQTGVVALGTDIAQLRWDGGDSLYATTAQIAVVIGGRQYFGKDYLTFNVSYGLGSGDNIMALTGSNSNATLTQDGALKTIPALTTVIGYNRKWSDNLSNTIQIAYQAIGSSEFRPPESMEAGAMTHVNALYQVTERLLLGIEYMYGQRRNKNNDYGDAHRIQAMAKFDF